MSVTSKALKIISEIELLSLEFIELLYFDNKCQDPSDYHFARILPLIQDKEDQLKKEIVKIQDNLQLRNKIKGIISLINSKDEELSFIYSTLRRLSLVLTNAVSQLHKKISLIDEANGNISVDSLIRYASHISASYSVAAPVNYDPSLGFRYFVGLKTLRPYPTDSELCNSILNTLKDAKTDHSFD